jgi:hypothetical protein
LVYGLALAQPEIELDLVWLLRFIQDGAGQVVIAYGTGFD